MNFFGSLDSFNILRLAGVLLVFFIILFSVIYYNHAIKRIKPNQALGGYALLIFMLINYFRNMTREILGEELEKLAPIFLTIFSYIAMSNVIGIIGVENPTSSVWVCLSLGLFSFIGIFVMGFRYQRFSFLYKFTFNIKIKVKGKEDKIRIPVMINPIEIMGSLTPLISLSFRLWGNIFAGALILFMVYNLPYAILISPDAILSGKDFIDQSPWVLLTVLLTPPMHAFFDIAIGLIQAMVFVLLTMVYWNISKEEH
ncbi:MAG: FoF1 ATP synthase subunit A [Mycoplasmoidaceae bacterium]